MLLPEMNPLSIRPLAEHDLADLLALYRELHPADMPLPPLNEVGRVWQSMLDDPKLHCLGGFLGDALVCSATLSISPNLTRGCRPYGLIENVITRSDHRRQGFGQRILAHAQKLAWENGCYKVMLMTSRQDPATQAFYESAGFNRHSKQAYYAAAPN